MNKKRGRGFTFVEVLIVTVIFSVISLAIYSTLRNGLSIWYRIRQSGNEEDRDLFLYKFTSDLQNSFPFAQTSLEGSEEEVSLWTFVKAADSRRKTVGKVTYRFEPGAEALLRYEKDYSKVSENTPTDESGLLEGVRESRFLYYTWDEQTKDYLWVGEWNERDLPRAVRLEFKVEDGDREAQFTRTVFLPLAR